MWQHFRIQNPRCLCCRQKVLSVWMKVPKTRFKTDCRFLNRQISAKIPREATFRTELLSDVRLCTCLVAREKLMGMQLRHVEPRVCWICHREGVHLRLIEKQDFIVRSHWRPHCIMASSLAEPVDSRSCRRKYSSRR